MSRKMEDRFPPPPENSNAFLSVDGSDVVIRFPPTGILPAYAGHVIFDLLTIATAVPVLLLGQWVSHQLGSKAIPWQFKVLAAAFVVSGLYLLGSTIQWGRARIELIADPSKLSATISGPFWTRRRQWRRSSLKEVKASYHGLTLTMPGAKEPAFFNIRHHALEHLWAAKVIRMAMEFYPPSELPALPKKTRVTYQRTGDFLHIALRPDRLQRGSLIFLCLLGLASLTTTNVMEFFHPDQGHSPSGAVVAIIFWWSCLFPTILYQAYQFMHPTFVDVLSNELAVVRPRFLRIFKGRWSRMQIVDFACLGGCLVLWFRHNSRIQHMTVWDSRKPAELESVAETIREELNLGD